MLSEKERTVVSDWLVRANVSSWLSFSMHLWSSLDNVVLLGGIPKGACIVRGKEALMKGSFGAVKSTCRWIVHAGARTEAQLLALWKQTVWTISGKCAGSGTWQLSTQGL